MATWCQRSAWPTHWSRRPNASDQKYGRSSYGRSRPRTAWATVAAWPARARPVLHAELASEEGAMGDRDVSARVDVREVRPPTGVGRDSAHCTDELAGRNDADAHEDYVGVDLRAVGERHPAGLDPIDPHAEPNVDALVPPATDEQRADLHAERPPERDGRGLDERHLEAEPGRRRGDLRADEPCA